MHLDRTIFDICRLIWKNVARSRVIETWFLHAYGKVFYGSLLGLVVEKTRVLWEGLSGIKTHLLSKFFFTWYLIGFASHSVTPPPIEALYP